jgi:hypothetical protein
VVGVSDCNMSQSGRMNWPIHRLFFERSIHRLL